MHTHARTYARPGCAIITRFYEAKNHIGHVRTRPAAARTINNNAVATSSDKEEEEVDRTLRAALDEEAPQAKRGKARRGEASERAERVNMAAPRVSGPGPPRSLRVTAAQH